MVETGAIFLAGVFAWTFVEYLIHGWLSHTFHSFAMPLHAVHHRDPAAVFTIGAWVPLTLIWLAARAIFGSGSGTVFFSGIVSGFVAYEAVHYRIHFRWPRNRLEQYLRSRHLVHHDYSTNSCLGVTSPLWDLVFGTEPLDTEMIRLCALAATKEPVRGRTNLYKLPYFLLPRGGRK